MTYHFNPSEYNYLIQRTIGNLVITNIEYCPDDTYNMTDGHAGNPYLLILSNGDTFKFRYFQEVINKYGVLIDEKE